MSPRNVYVVATGEHGEGHSPERAFSNLDGAREWAADQWGVTPTALGVGTWKANINRCDEVWIYRMKVWDR